MVSRGVVQGDPAFLAKEFALQEAASDAVELGHASLDMEWGFEPGDLLAQQTDTSELQDPFNLQLLAVGRAADLFDLTRGCARAGSRS